MISLFLTFFLNFGIWNKMMVMPANGSYGWLHYWAGRAPGSIGHLYSPGGQRGPYHWLPYALDNGAYTRFCEDRWRKLLEWAAGKEQKPLWVAVPDVFGDAQQTLTFWSKYVGLVKYYRFVPAFVVQDGHKAKHVPDEAQIIFVGGTTAWKKSTIAYWCDHFSRVHVGRINTYRWLRYCADAGVESVDGTGFGRGDQIQLAGLIRFLEEDNK